MTTAKEFFARQDALRKKEADKKYREDNRYYLTSDEGDTTRFKSRGDVTAYKKDQAMERYVDFLRKEKEGTATATDSLTTRQDAPLLPNVKAEDYERPEPEKVEVEKIEQDDKSGKWYVNTYDTWNTKDGTKENKIKQRDAKTNEIPVEQTRLSTELPKAKERIILNDPVDPPTTQDSLMIYNAGILDKDISDAEAKRYKPHSLKKAEFQKKSVELKETKGNDGYSKFYMKDRDGNWVKIDESLYKAINKINEKRLESIPKVREAKKSLKKKTKIQSNKKGAFFD